MVQWYLCVRVGDHDEVNNDNEEENDEDYDNNDMEDDPDGEMVGKMSDRHGPVEETVGQDQQQQGQQLQRGGLVPSLDKEPVSNLKHDEPIFSLIDDTDNK